VEETGGLRDGEKKKQKMPRKTFGKESDGITAQVLKKYVFLL